MSLFSKVVGGAVVALWLLTSWAGADIGVSLPRDSREVPPASNGVSQTSDQLPVQVAMSTRMEYLFKAVPDKLALQYFIARYPRAYFTHHPTMNGFYARGTREDLLAIKRELVDIEKTAKVPPIPPISAIPLSHVKSEDAVVVLRHWVIGVECSNGVDSVYLKGDPNLRHEAAMALEQIVPRVRGFRSSAPSTLLDLVE